MTDPESRVSEATSSWNGDIAENNHVARAAADVWNKLYMAALIDIELHGSSVTFWPPVRRRRRKRTRWRSFPTPAE